MESVPETIGARPVVDGGVIRPPVEGRLIHGFEGADVGDKLRVHLVHTDVERGYIDFKRVD